MDDLNKPIITVVIPVYNSEKYIEQCINHILDENLCEVEVIVVNDGSTDQTVEKLAKFIDRITVISKNNGGVSSARNKGIENAHGTYVTFLDVDDEIPNGVLAKYLELIKKYSDIELVQGCFSEPEKTNEIYEIASQTVRKICLGYPRSLKQFPSIKYEVKAGVHGCYGKLFNLQIIKKNNLRFDEQFGLGEDLLFYFDYLGVVRNVYILERATYKINYVSGSATRSLNKKMPIYALEFSNTLLKRIQENDVLYPEAVYQINIHVSKAISSYFGHPLNKDRNRKKDLKKYLENPSIHKAYVFLASNEKSLSRKVKYWVLQKRYINLYCIFEKIYYYTKWRKK